VYTQEEKSTVYLMKQKATLDGQMINTRVLYDALETTLWHFFYAILLVL